MTDVESISVELDQLVHDLKNALSVILNYSLLIEEEAGLEGRSLDDLKEVRTSAERSLELSAALSKVATDLQGVGD